MLVGSSEGPFPRERAEPPTEQLARRWPRIALRVGLLVLFVWICLDLLNATVLGGLFAIVLHPWHVKLRKKFPKTSPLMLTIASLLLVIFPLAFVATQAVISANELLGGDPQQALEGAQSSAMKKMSEIARDYNLSVSSVRQAVSDAGKRVGAAAAGFLGTMAKGLPAFLIDLFIFVIALFYFIRDGERLRDWMKQLTPFKQNQTEELFGAVNDTVRGAILGTIAVAVVQGALTLIVLLIFKVPGAFLWGVVGAFFSLIPVFGTAPVTVGSAIYLLASGQKGAAIGMLVAAFLIGFSDNIVRPWVQSSRGKMHPLLAMLAIFGGLNVFGAFGIFIGPVVAAMAIWAIESWRKRQQKEIHVPVTIDKPVEDS